MINFLVVLGGIIFGLGLSISGMVQPEVVLDFLKLQNLGLMFVMGTGIVVASLFFHLSRRFRKKSVTGKAFEKYDSSLTKKTIVGGIIFGIGWGIAGVCPGSTVAGIGAGNLALLVSLAGMFIGSYIEKLVNKD